MYIPPLLPRFEVRNKKMIGILHYFHYFPLRPCSPNLVFCTSSVLVFHYCYNRLQQSLVHYNNTQLSRSFRKSETWGRSQWMKSKRSAGFGAFLEALGIIQPQLFHTVGRSSFKKSWDWFPSFLVVIQGHLPFSETLSRGLTWDSYISGQDTPEWDPSSLGSLWFPFCGISKGFCCCCVFWISARESFLPFKGSQEKTGATQIIHPDN